MISVSSAVLPPKFSSYRLVFFLTALVFCCRDTKLHFVQDFLIYLKVIFNLLKYICTYTSELKPDVKVYVCMYMLCLCVSALFISLIAVRKKKFFFFLQYNILLSLNLSSLACVFINNIVQHQVSHICNSELNTIQSNTTAEPFQPHVWPTSEIVEKVECPPAVGVFANNLELIPLIIIGLNSCNRWKYIE